MRRFHARRAIIAVALLITLQAASAATLTIDVRTPQGAPVQDAVVWLESAAGPGKPAPRPVEIQQADQEFSPFVTVVATGTRVLFPNRDKVKHHVYSFSPAKSFEIQLYSGTPTEPVVFDKAGVVVVGCNIHDWMLAYIVVLDSPWFSKTTSAGQAHMANLPTGRYVLHVWHPSQKADAAMQAIELGGTQTRQQFAATLELLPSPKKPRRSLGETY